MLVTKNVVKSKNVLIKVVTYTSVMTKMSSGSIPDTPGHWSLGWCALGGSLQKLVKGKNFTNKSSQVFFSYEKKSITNILQVDPRESTGDLLLGCIHEAVTS